ncbi:MAG: FAD-dependent thymidylate synthase [Candidatus Thorarchaeota archaeon]
MRKLNEKAENLIDLYFPVLDHGFVSLKDYCGGDSSITRAARTSYQHRTTTRSTNRGLICYLLRHNHSTPFEFVNFTAYGVRDDIEKFTYEKSLDMAKKWFGTPRKIVIVGHDVCYYGGYVHSSYPKNNAFGDYDVPIEKVPKEDKTVVSLVWKRPIPIDQGPKINLLTRCIASGLESPLYQEVREKRGLAYFLDFSSNCIGNDIVLTLFSQTANETTSQTIDTCIDFFEKDVSDIITKDRFEDCKQGLICQKKEGEILSHEGVWYTEMESFNQFDGIDDFTYSQLVDFGNKLFSYRDNYKIIV